VIATGLDQLNGGKAIFVATGTFFLRQ
jgi:hypothetical protein